MKKFVSFCVAVAIAASAVPAMAQCASCGGAPAFSQPVASYMPQASYSAPVYSAPIQSAPVYSPQFQSAPVYSAPMQSSPVYSAPMQSSPVYGAQFQSAPVYSSPVVSSPCGGCSGCSGCGGGIVNSGIVNSGIVSGGIIEGGVVNGGIISNGIIEGSSLPSGAQIISWEGGQEIQGTIVSDVLLEGGEATEDGESTVDVVEPPAASAEDAPGPDSGEEETEGET